MKKRADKVIWYVLALVAILLLMLIFRDDIGLSPRNKAENTISQQAVNEKDRMVESILGVKYGESNRGTTKLIELLKANSPKNYKYNSETKIIQSDGSKVYQDNYGTKIVQPDGSVVLVSKMEMPNGKS